jgi:hypothetical protein
VSSVGVHADWLLSAAILSGTAFLLTALLLFPYGRDQGVFAVIGQGILDGAAPYRDRWDLKPPGIYFLNALARALFGRAAWGIRIVEAAAIVSLLPAFRILSRRYLGSTLAGTLGFGVAVLMHVQLDFWHTAQAESFGGVLVTWAVVCVALAGSGTMWLLAGALYGAAFLLKPFLATGAAVGLVLAVGYGMRASSGASPRRRLSAPACLLAGFLLPVAAAIAYFVAKGAWPHLVEALFRFAPRYAAIEADRAPFAWFMGFALFRALLAFGNFTLPGLSLLALLPPQTAGERRGAVHAGMVALLLLAGVAWQAKLFAYHYGGALPLIALLAGWGLWKGWSRWRAIPAGASAFSLAVLLLASLPPIAPGNPAPGSVWLRAWRRIAFTMVGAPAQDRLDAINSRNDVSASENRQVAEWIRDHTPAGAPLFVWGFQPGLYDMADRRPASRYITNQPQRVSWSRDASRRRLMEDLEAHSPAAVVVARGDVFPRVVGNDRDSEAELQQFPELLELLARSYDPAVRIGRFDVYLRRP